MSDIPKISVVSFFGMSLCLLLPSAHLLFNHGILNISYQKLHYNQSSFIFCMQFLKELSETM